VPLIRKCHPAEADVIELGKDAYVDHLYGCFRVDNPLGDRFQREREAMVVLVPRRSVRVIVPERMKVALPEDGNLAAAEMFRILPVGGEQDTMHLLSMRAGWNQNDRDVARIIGFDPKGAFCTKLQGDGFDIPVATGVVTPLGRYNSWIGRILVHPELRRQGVATAVMQHLLRYAIDAGKVINGLDATPMGSTVYVSLGYVGTFRIWRSVLQTAEFADAKARRARPINEDTLEEVLRYDNTCFVERGNVLRALYADSEGQAFFYPNDRGEIAGYGFGRPGRIRPFVGPLVADSPEAAADLLAAIVPTFHKQGHKDAFIDTPEIWFAERGVYDKSVFDQPRKPSGHRLIKSATPVRDFTRMYQAVDSRQADALVRAFAGKYNFADSDPRVVEFARTLHQSVGNYTETVGFMQLEERELQKKVWGTTGPEKG
jgi:GNAT superfamily N-acetyltransferase